MKRKNRVLAAVLWVAALCSTALSYADEPATVPKKEITLGSLGEECGGLVQRVQKHLHSHIWVKPRIIPHLPGNDPDVDAKLRAAAGESSVCTLLLVNLAEGSSFATPSDNTVILDVWKLRPAEANSAEQQETYARRVEKQAVEAVCLHLGLARCPMPRCALYDAVGDADLDLKGRTLCPPCMPRAQKRLRELGLELRLDNPDADK